MACFQMPKKIINYKWELVTLFASREDFNDTVKAYAVHSGGDFQIQEKDNIRVRVVCKREGVSG